MFVFIIVPFLIFPILVLINFFYHLAYNEFYSRPAFMKVIEIWTVLIAPFLFLSFFDWNQKNDCCSDSAVFAPDNRIGIYVLILLCMVAYFCSSFRCKIMPPVAELLINSLLVLGMVLNIVISIQISDDLYIWILGNVPIIMLFLIEMKRNQALLKHALQHDGVNPP